MDRPICPFGSLSAYLPVCPTNDAVCARRLRINSRWRALYRSGLRLRHLRHALSGGHSPVWRVPQSVQRGSIGYHLAAQLCRQRLQRGA